MKTILYIFCLGLFFHLNDLKATQVNRLEIVNDELKNIMDNTFGALQKGQVILVRVDKFNNRDYELKIIKENTLFLVALLRNVYEYNDLTGFFEYGGGIGIVYGEKKNIFFKKTGKMDIPEFYLEAIEILKRPYIPIDIMNSDIPPIRYDNSVLYYKYQKGQLIFDRFEWANIWGIESSGRK